MGRLHECEGWPGSILAAKVNRFWFQQGLKYFHIVSEELPTDVFESMKTLSIQLFVASLFLIQSTSGQCPSKCFCLDGSVTCSDLKLIPITFPEDTRHLTISEIDVEQIPAGIFNRLPMLESIEIYDGNVGKISSDAFQSLSLLEFITLSELSIGTIESYAFYNITDTGSVTLDMSTIDLIQPYAFFDMFAIDHIKISSNEVKYIDSFAFSTIDELLEFSFQSNHVETMKPYAFSQFSNLYEFSMHLNTLDDIGCGSFQSLLYQTEEQSFYSNTFACTCNIVWTLNHPALNTFLVSNTCHLPGTEEKISWENVSIETLHCSENDQYACPSAEYFEMLIPNVRITSSTTESITRTSSRTTFPHTPSNTDNPQEDWSRELKVTPTKTSTDRPLETSSHKITSTTIKSLSTFEKTTTKVTTKTSTTKPPTTSSINVNIENTKSVFLPSNPKIVIPKNTVEVKFENNTKQKRGSDEPVSVVFKETERNGAEVKFLCWLGIMTVFALAII